jgi:hypothetical protein
MMITLIQRAAQVDLKQFMVEAFVRMGGVAPAEAERSVERALADRTPSRESVLAELSERIFRAVRGDDGLLADLLRQFGLPDTPKALAYTRARAVGDTTVEPPVRGLLVTTKVYAASLAKAGVAGRLGGRPCRWEWDGKQASVIVVNGHEQPGAPPAVWVHDGHPRCSIEGDSVGWTEQLDNAARRIRQAHLDWLSRWRPAMLADRRKKLRLVGGYGEPRCHDYLSEALRPDNLPRLQRAARRHPHALDLVLDDYLDDVYHKTYRALQRAGLPTAVQPGWREQAKAQLRPLLIKSVTG